jgi:hypothetical protein
MAAMASPVRLELESTPTTECQDLRISYIEDEDAISLEHYSENGLLLSEAIMSIEDAYDYAKSIIGVADKALGIV